MYFFRRKKNTQVKKDTATVIDKEIIKEYEGAFFRTYSYLDLLNIVHMQNIVSRGQEFSTIPDFPDQTILSVYDGRTLFSIF